MRELLQNLEHFTDSHHLHVQGVQDAENIYLAMYKMLSAEELHNLLTNLIYIRDILLQPHSQMLFTICCGPRNLCATTGIFTILRFSIS